MSAWLHIWMEYETRSSVKRKKRLPDYLPRKLINCITGQHFQQKSWKHSDAHCRFVQGKSFTHERSAPDHLRLFMHGYTRQCLVNLLNRRVFSLSWKSVQKQFWQIPKHWYLVHLPNLPVMSCAVHRCKSEPKYTLAVIEFYSCLQRMVITTE